MPETQPDVSGGFSAEDARGIVGENWLRVSKAVWPLAGSVVTA
jgi:hypothetical protein